MTMQDAQVRKMMKEYALTGSNAKAAEKSGMDHKTAKRWRKAKCLPSERQELRKYRTRTDAFAEVWPEVEKLLDSNGHCEAKFLFEHLQREHPGKWPEAALRTFQRRVTEWRGKNGPEKEIFFPQEHVPGEAIQVDFTHIRELKITIAGAHFLHLICHAVLPYSNWEWATLCKSESIPALKNGIQSAIFQLGATPTFIQTDNSTSATHVNGGNGASVEEVGKTQKNRAFNHEYLRFCKEFNLIPRTIAIGKKEQNGDIESANNHLKRAISNGLTLRGSHEFADIDQLEQWVETIVVQRNRSSARQTRLSEEIAKMARVTAIKVPEYLEYDAVVSRQGTISIARNIYSIPSRLIGKKVQVRVFEWHLEVHFAMSIIVKTEKMAGRYLHKIDYRHVIDSLIRKPAAFARYRYRQDMFPRECFKTAYEKICGGKSETKFDLEYLRILHLSARMTEDDVATALELFLENNKEITAEAIKLLVESKRVPLLPYQEPLVPNLSRYNNLLQEAI